MRTNSFIALTWHHFGGGGGGYDQPAVPAPTAPVTPNAAAEVAAQQSVQRQQLKRKSISSTVYAGANMGYTPAAGGGLGTQAGSGPSVNSGGSNKTGG